MEWRAGDMRGGKACTLCQKGIGIEICIVEDEGMSVGTRRGWHERGRMEGSVGGKGVLTAGS